MATIPELPTFDLSPSTLRDIATDLVQVRQAVNDLVNHVSPQNATFENTLRPLADIDNELKRRVQYLALFQAVSPSLEMRNASSAAVNMVDKAYLGIFQTPSLFALVNAVYRNYVGTKSDDQKLLSMIHSMLWKMGLSLKGISGTDSFGSQIVSFSYELHLWRILVLTLAMYRKTPTS
ncbi:hypothetical protein N7491_001405 [Penicillium cf. griseofulvum]|uniref:Uncharacterized protein n=1 Tax=Penicillium cf. griseofulvum TaxID=2972120 RepID=A0A9W9JBK6_9EURO|nr:hypothetical protein N7472_006535 [Penicillium cf. griseofulvum]KAJ5445323.1 hypothetical protein N7491_001405 [Penicillium cf. griseofulvum]KAJ5447041.1 hypothetical protein N7445_001862 [Penicillium cf. griseofulvum]